MRYPKLKVVFGESALGGGLSPEYTDFQAREIGCTWKAMI
jgi:hypothetical protein